jgi:hypothetical protein
LYDELFRGFAFACPPANPAFSQTFSRAPLNSADPGNDPRSFFRSRSASAAAGKMADEGGINTHPRKTGQGHFSESARKKELLTLAARRFESDSTIENRGNAPADLRI